MGPINELGFPAAILPRFIQPLEYRGRLGRAHYAGFGSAADQPRYRYLLSGCQRLSVAFYLRPRGYTRYNGAARWVSRVAD